jgi:hypothetical protein
MKKRYLIGFGVLILVAAGGFLAVDAGMDGNAPTGSKAATSFKACSLCDAHKADLVNMRRYKEERNAREELGAEHAQ